MYNHEKRDINNNQCKGAANNYEHENDASGCLVWIKKVSVLHFK